MAKGMRPMDKYEYPKDNDDKPVRVPGAKGGMGKPSIAIPRGGGKKK